VLQLPVTVQERDANHKAEAVLSESPAEIAF